MHRKGSTHKFKWGATIWNSITSGNESKAKILHLISLTLPLWFPKANLHLLHCDKEALETHLFGITVSTLCILTLPLNRQASTSTTHIAQNTFISSWNLKILIYASNIFGFCISAKPKTPKHKLHITICHALKLLTRFSHTRASRNKSVDSSNSWPCFHHAFHHS